MDENAPENMRVLAARVAGQSEMVDVRMVKSDFEHLSFPEPGIPISYDLDVQPAAQLTPDSDAVIVSVDFGLKMSQGDSEPMDIAKIEFTLVGLYTLPEGTDFAEEEIDSFGRTTGVFALYPYAREYIQDVTGRLGLPALTLGLYRMPGSQDPH